jgi:carbon monoxide dehydrogenase subunit G
MDRRHALAVLGTCVAAPAYAVKEDTGTWVAVMRRGEIYGVDAVIVVPVTPQQAWDVLIDFDAMARFLPNVTSSRIVGRSDDVLQVEQRGELKWGPVIEPFESRRDVRLTPITTLQSTSLAGAATREQGVTRLKPVPAGTEVWHRGEMVFDSWMPNAVAERFLQKVMQERYQAFVDEMKRRAAAR